MTLISNDSGAEFRCPSCYADVQVDIRAAKVYALHDLAKLIAAV